jgi:hypothetical protein
MMVAESHLAKTFHFVIGQYKSEKADMTGRAENEVLSAGLKVTYKLKYTIRDHSLLGKTTIKFSCQKSSKDHTDT